MLSVSHAVTGAFIASKIPDPSLAIPLVLASHYLEDAVPHWDAGTGLGKGIKTPHTALLHEIPDLLMAAAVVLVFFPLPLRSLLEPATYLSSPQIWGALLGILPDILEAPRNFLRQEPFYLKHINKFHNLFHHSIPRIAAGLAPQLLLLVCLWLLR
jgi:hypothetical protein